MLAWQGSEVTAESVRKQAKEWVVTELKSKLAAKQMSRADFDKLHFTWRAKYVKSGGKVRD